MSRNLCFFAIQVLLVPLALAAPPSNDEFAPATLVNPGLPATLTGDAREATYQANEPIFVSVDWNDPSGILVFGQNIGLNRTSGTAKNGTWTGTVTINRTNSPPGGATSILVVVVEHTQ